MSERTAIGRPLPVVSTMDTISQWSDADVIKLIRALGCHDPLSPGQLEGLLVRAMKDARRERTKYCEDD